MTDERAAVDRFGAGPGAQAPSVTLVTMGCARNDVDSEELAGRLRNSGWRLVADAADADVALVNTCGFIEAAKKDSIDAVLEATELKDSGRTRAVVAVGCLAERYGRTLAEALPEADAVLGFDSYPDLADRLRSLLEGHPLASHEPRDRRRLLPIQPVDRPGQAAGLSIPGHDTAPGNRPVGDSPQQRYTGRVRLDQRPWAPLKIGSGCDRRCAFCAIPSFRGASVSRHWDDVVAEAQWLADQGVRELFLVSENTTAYGKDLGDLRALEALLPRLAEVTGVRRVRVSYLQPAEIRPALIEVIAQTPGVAAYFDISFQHAAEGLLRRMNRFGSTPFFLDLLNQIRRRNPQAGIRTNVIVGFPGETEQDLEELELFLERARFDAVGVFGYSDEEGTSALELPDHVDPQIVAERVGRIGGLVEELTAQRAEERVGERVQVIVEELEPADDALVAVGRAASQGPEVDGSCEIALPTGSTTRIGDLVTGEVVGTDGVDLLVETR